MPVLPSDNNSQASISPTEKPPTKTEDDHGSLPLTLLEIRSLSSSGARRFLHSVDASKILIDAIRKVQQLLTPNGEGTPNVRSITLILRDFDGVAYTTGKDIDFEHKEIHFSTGYIESIAADPERIKDEITGVLVHEMVHVLQWNGQHRCNGGLIEGIADWVRLKSGLVPPHWRQRCDDCDWDQGYEITAYFLEWLNDRFGKDTVVKINQELRTEYVEDKFWKEAFAGKDVTQLWGMYAQTLADKQGDKEPSLSHTQSKTSEHESAINDRGDITPT